MEQGGDKGAITKTYDLWDVRTERKGDILPDAPIKISAKSK